MTNYSVIQLSVIEKNLSLDYGRFFLPVFFLLSTNMRIFSPSKKGITPQEFAHI